MQLSEPFPCITEHTGRQTDRKAINVANTGYPTNPSNPFSYCLQLQVQELQGEIMQKHLF